ncbi:hypothetical protein Ae706Ps2_0539 [Pseudonocardia sp. Ae706_Ps2]|nr:hypothetical protein Ae706Ps2_0539 [Pseudonocardia sp. Ae706_Ps2]
MIRSSGSKVVLLGGARETHGGHTAGLVGEADVDSEGHRDSSLRRWRVVRTTRGG